MAKMSKKCYFSRFFSKFPAQHLHIFPKMMYNNFQPNLIFEGPNFFFIPMHNLKLKQAKCKVPYQSYLKGIKCQKKGFFEIGN